MAKSTDYMAYQDGANYDISGWPDKTGEALIREIIRRYKKSRGVPPDRILVNPDVQAPDKVDDVEIFESPSMPSGHATAGMYDPEYRFHWLT